MARGFRANCGESHPFWSDLTSSLRSLLMRVRYKSRSRDDNAMLGARNLRPNWAGWPARRPDGLSQAVADALALLQYKQLRDSIPVIYVAVAAITIGAALANQNVVHPMLQLGFPAIILLASAIQVYRWRSRATIEPTLDVAQRQIGRTTVLAIAITSFGSLWAVIMFMLREPGQMPMAPMFMFFGVFAVANSIASLPRAALAILIFGLSPICIAMLMSGDAGLGVLSISVALVCVIQVQLLLTRFADMAQNLILREELESLARTDPLTGLLNRRALAIRLEERLNDPQTTPFVVALLDLDQFKPVNDKHGHAAGDALLCALASRLTQSLREGDLVARLGGDEFALVFDAPRDAEALQSRIAALSAGLARPYRLAGTQIRVPASIGAALFPDDGRDHDSLLKVADTALYKAKEQAGQALRAIPISRAKR
jgi:diguanylate cyclase